MKLYHRTDHADVILADGFRDGADRSYGLVGMVLRGVWVSNVPLDGNEGAVGADVIVGEVPEEDIADFEVIEEGKGYREWCVPGAVLNRQRWTRATETDVDDAITRRILSRQPGA